MVAKKKVDYFLRGKEKLVVWMKENQEINGRKYTKLFLEDGTTVLAPREEEPVIEEPVIEEPVIEEPVIEEPVIEEPVIEEPKVEKSKDKKKS